MITPDDQSTHDENLTEILVEREGLNDCSWRRGKWTHEEEQYANLLIEAFNDGRLPQMERNRISLRTYLAMKLNCSRMRISKKFAGVKGLGSRYYHREDTTAEEIRQHQRDQIDYESKFLMKESLVKQCCEKRKRDSETPAIDESETLTNEDGSMSPEREKETQKLPVNFDFDEFLYLELGINNDNNDQAQISESREIISRESFESDLRYLDLCNGPDPPPPICRLKNMERQSDDISHRNKKICVEAEEHLRL
mmetsp:Transcript_16801/g.16892  ORF Transcript_16801/g.16892 Transcript_16801/m.16892 type:complete len:253 (+) Transcript_16801:59-817(+)